MLVVAHKTAATQPLLDAVRERAAARTGHVHAARPERRPRPAQGRRPRGPGTRARPGRDRRRRCPLLSEAAGSPVEGIVGDPDPVAAIQDAVNLRGFDEIIISTLPARLSRWLKLDLPSKVSGTGLPVTTVTPADVPVA